MGPVVNTVLVKLGGNRVNVTGEPGGFDWAFIIFKIGVLYELQPIRKLGNVNE